VRLLLSAFLLIITALAAQGQSWAHGVYTHNNSGKATIVTVTHDDGTPLAFASFSVHSPHEGPAFAKGQTDSLGRVVFIPNSPGKWEIKIFSDDGHGAVATIDILPEDALVSHDTKPQPLGKIQKLITGVGILFGIFGLLVLVQNRKPTKD